VVARGADVHFDKNAMMEVRFGTRTVPNGAKFLSSAVKGVEPSIGGSGR
jgi:hypothetical protein